MALCKTAVHIELELFHMSCMICVIYRKKKSPAIKHLCPGVCNLIQAWWLLPSSHGLRSGNIVEEMSSHSYWIRGDIGGKQNTQVHSEHAKRAQRVTCLLIPKGLCSPPRNCAQIPAAQGHGRVAAVEWLLNVFLWIYDAIEDMDLQWDMATSHARTSASLAHTMPCMLPSMRGKVEIKICPQGGPFANLQRVWKTKSCPFTPIMRLIFDPCWNGSGQMSISEGMSEGLLLMIGPFFLRRCEKAEVAPVVLKPAWSTVLRRVYTFYCKSLYLLPNGIIAVKL